MSEQRIAKLENELHNQGGICDRVMSLEVKTEEIRKTSDETRNLAQMLNNHMIDIKAEIRTQRRITTRFFSAITILVSIVALVVSFIKLA